MTKSETAKTKVFKMRIGQTTYRASVHFNKASTETLDDKILRLIRNEVTVRGR